MSDISIGRFRGGFCVYWHEGGKRRRYQLAACTRKEAEAEALAVYRRETRAEGGDTIADLWEVYRMEMGNKPTATTMAYTGRAVLTFFGALRPDEITLAHCRKYAAQRFDEGKAQGTIHTELGHLRSALRFAERAGIIRRAPYIWRPEKPDSDIKILTPGEIRAIIDNCIEHHVRTAVILLFGTGARVGAVLDLTWDRIDFERGVINLRIDGSATRKGRAVVPMNPSTRSALEQASDAALTDHVIEWGGKPVKCIRKGVVSAMERAGIKARIHDFRHTAAVTMLGAGYDMKLVSQILGHSNIATTFKVYGRFMPEHMQEAVNVLDFASLQRRKEGF